MDLTAFAVRDHAGQAVCYVAVERDVTAERHAAVQLEGRFVELKTLYRMSDAMGHAVALEQIYDEALEGLRDALRADRASVLLFDDDGVMRFKAWRGLSDAYRAAVEGHSPWKRDTLGAQPVVVPDVKADPALAALHPVLEREGIRSVAFIPLTDARGVLGKFMLYFDAPHEWSDAESRLARSIARHVSLAIVRHRSEAEVREANRAKSVFLATMSHELRTPLNAIAGYTDLLDAGIHGDMPSPQREAVQRIQANQRHLLRLIDDVLNFAKLEAGHLEFDMADVPVQETLDGTRALIETQLLAKGIVFDFRRGDPHVTCRADRAKMLQVVVNLLSNAYKFTPSGGTVAIGWTATDDEVRVQVEDTGPGIASEHLETIFAPFVQLQMGFRRKVEGTGLGLAISRELARGMRGDVGVTSQVGSGSIFTLTLRRRD